FDLTERDGVLYGRGVIDDKGPTVAALFALRAVIECGCPLRRGVRLIVGCAEETGSEDIAYYAARESFPPMVFTPDGDFPVITIEKGHAFPTLTAHFEKADAPRAVIGVTADGPVNAVPGTATARLRGFDIETLRPLAEAFSADPAHPALTLAPDGGDLLVTAKGRAAHASTPEMGVNALTGLLAWLTALPLTPTPAHAALHELTRLFPHGETDGAAAGLACRDDESGALTLAFSRLRFSETELVAETDIRFPVCRTLRQVTDALQAAAASAGLTAQVEGVEPHHVNADSPFVQTLLGVYEQVTGEPGKPLAIGGGTYVHGIPGGVAFGAEFPGDDNRMHGADERLSLARLEQMTLIYAHAIARLCGPAGGEPRP
ncbi:MAG: Sapep family Mn(2+)-dependent dipeptidase, partial [Clostridia bacterium]|nr:Sapep family Mn(2+)-dependent dipeptidase [Clostridia bacterium]